MNGSRVTNDSARIYRVDRFTVPAAARSEFVERVLKIHELLRTLPGFLHDHVLEQAGDSGELKFVTIAIWESAEAVVEAKKAVAANYASTGFDPGDLFAKLGIEADFATYSEVSA